MLALIKVAPSRRFLNFLLFTEIQVAEGLKTDFFQHFSKQQILPLYGAVSLELS